MVWYVRGGVGPEDHMEGGNIQGETKTLDNMPILWGGAHSVVYDCASEADAEYRSSNQL